jgi:hypothetical protein
VNLEMKLAFVCFGAASILLLWAFIQTVLRWAVFHVAAKATHAFYVSATGIDPQCATCPFNLKCPYSNGIVCRFTSHRHDSATALYPSRRRSEGC